MRPISADLRQRIHEACLAGETTAEVAERFAVSTAIVRRIRQRFRQTGSLAPKAHAGGPARKLAAQEEALRQAVGERPDATPQEYQDRLKLPASRVTVWRTLCRPRISRKKMSTHAAEQGRPDGAEARRKWPQKLAGVAPKDLVTWKRRGRTRPCNGRTATPQSGGAWSPRHHWRAGRR